MSSYDINNIPELVKELRNLDRIKTQLGIVAPSGDKLYMIGWVHEFGIDIQVTEAMRGWFQANGMPLKKETTKIHIPERRYFSSAFDKNKSAITDKAMDEAWEVLQQKKTAKQARKAIGEFVADKIKENIVSVDLVETGKLKDNIGYREVLE